MAFTAEGIERLRQSRLTSNSDTRMDSIKNYWQAKKSISTIDQDMATLDTDLQKVSQSWQSADTINASKTNVQNMINRLNGYRGYLQSTNPEAVSALEENIKRYSDILSALEETASEYGKYKTAEEYEKTQKQITENAKWANADSATLEKQIKILEDELNAKYKEQDQNLSPMSQAEMQEHFAKMAENPGYNNEDISNKENTLNLLKTFYSQNKLKEEFNAKWSEFSGNIAQQDESVSDQTYEIINGGKIDRLLLTGAAGARIAKTKDRADAMEENEKLLYNWLYENKGKKVAQEYFDDLSRTYLDQRVNEDIQNQMQSFAGKNWLTGILGSAASVGTSILSGPEALMNLGAEALEGVSSGNFENVGTTRSQMSTITQGLRAGTQSQWEDSKNKKLWNLLYNTAMSGVDSLTAAKLGVATKIPWLGELTLGASAAASKMNDLLDSGATGGTAILGGVMAGTLESLFEHVTIGNINSLKGKAVRDILKDFGWSKKAIAEIGKDITKNVVVNASEEWATEVGNIIADEIIAGELSNYATMVADNYANGMTLEEAQNAAQDQLKENILTAAASGGLMGGGISTIGAVAGAVQESAANKKAGKTILNNSTLGNLVSLAEQTGDKKLAEDAQQLTDNSKPGKIGSVARRTYEHYAQSSARQLTEALKATGLKEKEATFGAQQIIQTAFATGDKAGIQQISLMMDQRFGKTYGEFIGGAYGYKDLQSANRVLNQPEMQKAVESADAKAMTVDNSEQSGYTRSEIDVYSKKGEMDNGQTGRDFSDSGRIGHTEQNNTRIPMGKSTASIRRLKEMGDAIGNDGTRSERGVYFANRRKKVSRGVKENLKTTAITDETGNPIVVYHSTPNLDFMEFGKGDIGFHFGSTNQAIKRAEDKNYLDSGRVIQAYLNIKKPLYINYDPMNWKAKAVALTLCYRQNILTEQQYEKISKLSKNGLGYDSPASVELRKMLQDMAYDGIVYDNGFEGDGKSYIAFYPEQVIIIDDGLNNDTQADSDGSASFMPESDSDVQADASIENDIYAKPPEFWQAQNKNPISKSLKDKIAALFGRSNVDISIGEIVKQIQKDFQIPISKGKFRFKAYGIYKKKAEAIRTKIENALPTIAHELGHHLDKKYGLRDLFGIEEALHVLETTRPDFYNAYKQNQRPGEAVAEFIREYLTDRTMAEKKYPSFFKEFERALGENGAEDLKNIQAIGDKINEYMTATAAARARSAVITRAKAKRINAIGKGFGYYLEKAQTEMLDDATALKKVSQLAYDLYYWAKKSSVRAKNSISGYYMSGFQSDMVQELDENGKPVFDKDGNKVYVPALRYITQDIKQGQMQDDFEMYLIYKHGITWLEQDKRVFADDNINNKAHFESEIQKFEKQYPEFKEISENLSKWYRTFLYEFGVKSGLLTKEALQKLMDKYPNYIPLMRNVEGANYGTRRGSANQNAPIQRAKGSGLEILSPLESLVIKIEQFMKAADRNAVMQEIAKTADSEDGLGYLLEEVPPDRMPVTVSTANAKAEMEAALSGIGADQSDVDAFSELLDRLMDETITEFRINPRQGNNVVVLRENGERRYFQVHDDLLLTTLTGFSPTQYGGFTRAIGNLTRLFKAFTTGNNAVWSLVSNAPRDFDSAYKYGSENNFIKYTLDYFKAIKYAFSDLKGDNADEILKIYKSVGGGYNNPLINGKEMRSAVRDIFSKNNTFAERIKNLFSGINLIDRVENFSGAIETAPRLAEFKRVYEKTGDPVAALKASEEITVNFNRSGKTGKQFDQYIPYLNASLQGTSKFVTTLKNSLKKGGDKSFLAKVTISAILKVGLVTAISSLFGAEWDEEYEKLSAYKKNNFYNIYIGAGKFISIPKSKDTAVLDSFLERVVEVAKKSDPDYKQELEDFAGYMWLVFGPPLFDDAIVISTALELAKNENFTGAPIVSSYYEDLEPEMQYNEKTTALAKWIGKLFGWSPMKIDHVIKSNFGLFGQINDSLGAEDKDWSLGVKNKVLTDNAYSTDILNHFYDTAEDYAAKAKSYPNNAEYVYISKQYNATKSVISALNQYAKDDPQIARQYKIIARDYADSFEKSRQINNKLLKLLESTNNKEILYDKSFSPEYSIDKTKYTMDPEMFLDYVEEYYNLVEEQYDKILSKKYSDEATTSLLIDAKNRVEKQLSKKYKKKNK